MSQDDINSQSKSYWDRVSSAYDRLYINGWSRKEDEEASEWLKLVPGGGNGHTLDLACGTGLGYVLLQGQDRQPRYVGLDISPGMLTQFSLNHPGVTCLLGSMDDLSGFRDGEFDSVICLNAAFSFASDQSHVLSQIHRIVRPGGNILISVLNRWSLRRLLRCKYAEFESFATRGADPSLGTVYAHTFSKDAFFELLERSGFQRLKCFPQGVLSGVAEFEALIPVENILKRVTPGLAHTLNFIAERG